MYSARTIPGVIDMTFDCGGTITCTSLSQQYSTEPIGAVQKMHKAQNFTMH